MVQIRTFPKSWITGAFGAARVGIASISYLPGAQYVQDALEVLSTRVPPGGTTGQILTKSAAADFVAGWQDPAPAPGGDPPGQATETTAGIAEVATTAEAVAEADDARIMTPAKVAARIATRQATSAKDQNSGYAGLDSVGYIPDVRVAPGYYNIRKATYGAAGNGTTNDAPALQSAIDVATGAGGGTVVAPEGYRYNMASAVTIKSNVTVQFGNGNLNEVAKPNIVGPDINGIKTAVVLITQSATSPFTLEGNSAGIKGGFFLHPNQVSYTASAPTVYPATVRLDTSGAAVTSPKLENCFFVNSYRGVDFTAPQNRAMIKNCFIGAYDRCVIIDGAVDLTYISDVHCHPWWDISYGVTYNQTIDTSWVRVNGSGLTIRKADGIRVNNFFTFGKRYGLILEDSPNTTGFWASVGRNSYGNISGFYADDTSHGIFASSTAQTGYDLYGFKVYTGHTDKVGIQTAPGGTGEPNLRCHGGDASGAANYFLLHNSGRVLLSNYDINQTFAVWGIYYNNTSPDYLNLANNRFHYAGNNFAMVNAAPGRVIATGNDFNGTTSVPGTTPSGGYRARGNYGLADATVG